MNIYTWQTHMNIILSWRVRVGGRQIKNGNTENLNEQFDSKKEEKKESWNCSETHVNVSNWIYIIIIHMDHYHRLVIKSMEKAKKKLL